MLLVISLTTGPSFARGEDSASAAVATRSLGCDAVSCGMAMRPQIATEIVAVAARAILEILVLVGRCSSRIPRTRSSSDQWRVHIEVAPRGDAPGRPTARSKRASQ